MALPLNSLYGPTAGWTVQGGDGGDQNLVGNAGATPLATTKMADIATVTGGTDTVTEGALNSLLSELKSNGFMS